ncbi:MAG: hypothetical protein IJE05_07510 [Clostridia bacterium]|nr:hypothetical protein [Clostridia bacterium]
MQENFSIEINTSNMTLEELQEARNKIRKLLVTLDYQIALIKKAENKDSSE